jgi:hypothetical protein
MVKDYNIILKSKHDRKILLRSIHPVVLQIGNCRIYDDSLLYTRTIEIKQENLILDGWFMKISFIEIKDSSIFKTSIEINCKMCLKEEEQKKFVDKFILHLNNFL